MGDKKNRIESDRAMVVVGGTRCSARYRFRLGYSLDKTAAGGMNKSKKEKKENKEKKRLWWGVECLSTDPNYGNHKRDRHKRQGG